MLKIQCNVQAAQLDNATRLLALEIIGATWTICTICTQGNRCKTQQVL